jgi:hypothetical protein
VDGPQRHATDEINCQRCGIFRHGSNRQAFGVCRPWTAEQRRGHLSHKNKASCGPAAGYKCDESAVLNTPGRASAQGKEFAANQSGRCCTGSALVDRYEITTTAQTRRTVINSEAQVADIVRRMRPA